MNNTQQLATESFKSALDHAAMLRDAGYTHTVRTYDKYGSTAEVYYAFSVKEASDLAAALMVKGSKGEVTTLGGKLLFSFGPVPA